MRVIVADDHYLLREGLRALLADAGDIDVCATAGSAPELVAAVDALRPDAVVTDIRMPEGIEGITAAHAIRARHPGVAGRTALDTRIVDALIARRRTGALDALSDRERDVLREMARGLTNAGIARTLHLSESAVEKHVGAIFGKLGHGRPDTHRRVAAVLAYLADQP